MREDTTLEELHASILELRESSHRADAEFGLLQKELAALEVWDAAAITNFHEKIEQEQDTVTALKSLLQEKTDALQHVETEHAQWAETTDKYEAWMKGEQTLDGEDRKGLLNRLREIRAKRHRQSYNTTMLQEQLILKRKQCLDGGEKMRKIYVTNWRIQDLDSERRHLLVEGKKLKTALSKAEEERMEASSETRKILQQVRKIESLFKERSRFGAWLCDKHAQEDTENIPEDTPHMVQKESLRQKINDLRIASRLIRESLDVHKVNYDLEQVETAVGRKKKTIEIAHATCQQHTPTDVSGTNSDKDEIAAHTTRADVSGTNSDKDEIAAHTTRADVSRTNSDKDEIAAHTTHAENSAESELIAAQAYVKSTIDLSKLPAHPDSSLSRHEVDEQPTTKEKELLVSVFAALEFCSDMSAGEIDVVVENTQKYAFTGECFMREGTKGSHLFIVGLDSKCLVVGKEGYVTAVVTEGMALGSDALLFSSPRVTTVVAWEKAILWGVRGVYLRDLLSCRYIAKQLKVWTVLNSLECLQQLSQRQKDTLCEQTVLATYSAGDVIIAQHDVMHVVYLRAQGEVAFYKDGERVVQEPYPDVLGVEGGLNGEESASAQVVAVDDVVLLSLNRKVCHNVFGGRLRYVLSRNKVLHAMQDTVFGRFPTRVIQSLLETFEMAEFGQNENVSSMIRRHNLRYFVVTGGQLSVNDGETTYMLRQGSDFGEEFVLNPLMRLRQDIVATEPSVIAYFTPESLRSVLKFDDIYEALVFTKRLEVLQNIFVFRTLPASKLHQFVSCFSTIQRNKGDVLMHQGDDNGDTFYILQNGTVNIIKDGVFVKQMGEESFFGEQALLYDELRSATIVCDSPCTFWVVEKADFLKHIRGSIIPYLQERIALQETKIELSDLRSLHVIGRGGFGIVKMVRHRVTGTKYALKSVNRRAIVENGLTKAMNEERSILGAVDHPFIIKFVRSFKTQSHLHFLMELVTGGELFEVLNILGLLDVPQTRFYVGSIVLALEYLHERRIVFRDLKSENIMIDHQGFVRIIDFGVAKKLNTGRTYSFVGTPYFMAPEVILGKGYGTLADIFSMGVCMYDFMSGVFPFGPNPVGDIAAIDPITIFQAIIKHPVRQSCIRDESALSFLHGVLQKQPSDRLGSTIHGFLDIKNHAFFDAFNFDDLIGRAMVPPYVPQRQAQLNGHPLPRKDSVSSVGSAPSGFAPDEYDPNWIDPNPDAFAEF